MTFDAHRVLMDYSTTAKQILEKVGGKENIVNVSHCMTRLRLTLKDESIVRDGEIKAIKGVAGVMKKAGQYQIVKPLPDPFGN